MVSADVWRALCQTVELEKLSASFTDLLKRQLEEATGMTAELVSYGRIVEFTGVSG